MSRRYCDRYICEECPFHSKYTENLKKVMSENDIEEVEKLLRFADVVEDKLTRLYEQTPKFKKEWMCMIHYYNPNGIYD